MNAEKTLNRQPAAVWAGGWDHLFGAGSRETRCRVMLDVANSELIAAQMYDGSAWLDLDDAQRADLANSLFNANDVAASPEDWGFTPVTDGVAWAVAAVTDASTDADAHAQSGAVAVHVIGDPEGMNDDRASWAGVALEAFMGQTGTDKEDALSDLLCDLMHYCDRNAEGFEAALERARVHYDAETQPDVAADPSPGM